MIQAVKLLWLLTLVPSCTGRPIRKDLLSKSGRGHILATSATSRSSGTGLDLPLTFSPKLKSMKESFPFYHTSAEISAEVKHLAEHCNGALSIKTVSDGDRDIDVVTVRRPNSNPINRVFILFGEHSRELISPESGLAFLRGLCDEDQTVIQESLEDSEYQMILNGNPKSRLIVEDGDFCVRVNPDGVDLNRNWDESWDGSYTSLDTYPGPEPFSEPETRIFRKLVTEYKPTTFLSVHSGTKGMYMPWAYDVNANPATRNSHEMMEVLQALDKEHCECPFGAAGHEVGYSCPGTCLDWVYDKLSTPYAFAFEIFVMPSLQSGLSTRWEEATSSGGTSLLDQGAKLSHEHFSEVFKAHASDFVHLRANAEASQQSTESPEECFQVFNPMDEESYNETVKNWALAYAKMAKLVAGKLHNQKATK
mmetsp:Transcript_40761/g.89084  ORF Transcript_40761/g.89084 Transcript_40761/m.89084 type:complete len:422 (+) Transcript_40761:70-1335(+)